MKLLILAACLTLTQSTEYLHAGPPVIKIKNGEVITQESDHAAIANTLIKDKVSSVVKDYLAHKNVASETGIKAESVKHFLENHASDKIDHATNKLVTSYKFGDGNENLLSIPKKVVVSKIIESTSTQTGKHVDINSTKGKTLTLNTHDVKDNVKQNVKEYLENLRKDSIHTDYSADLGQELLKDLKFELSNDVNTYNLIKGNDRQLINEECSITDKIKNRLPNLKSSNELQQDTLWNEINYNKGIQDELKMVKGLNKIKYSEMNSLDEQALRKKLVDADLFIKRNLPKSKKKIIKRMQRLQKTILKNKEIDYNKEFKHFNDIKKAKIDLGKKYYKTKILTNNKPLKYDRLIRKKYKNLNKQLKLEKRYPKAKDYVHELIKSSKTFSEADKINLKAKLLEIKMKKKPKLNFDTENIKIFSKGKLQKFYTPLSEKLTMTDYELSDKLPEIKIKLENFQKNLNPLIFDERNKIYTLNDKLHLINTEKHKIHFDKDNIKDILHSKVAPKYNELLIQKNYENFLPDIPQFGALDHFNLDLPYHFKMTPSMKIPQLKHKLHGINLQKPHINLKPKFTALDTETLLIDIQPAKAQYKLNNLKTTKNKIMKDLKKQQNLLEDYEDSTYLNEINRLHNNELLHNYVPGEVIYKSEPVVLLDTAQNYDQIVDFDSSNYLDKLEYPTDNLAFNEYGILEDNLIKLKDDSEAKNHFKKLKNKASGDIHLSLLNGDNILKQKIHKLKDSKDNLDTDFDRLNLKSDNHAHFIASDGSDVLKGKIHKFKDHIDATKDQLSDNLDRLKYEKTLAVSNKIDILKEKKDKLNDYFVEEAEKNIDIDLDKMKKNAKELAFSDGTDILKEKIYELENNVEETKHHVNDNLERLKFEKKIAISKKINSLKEKKDQLNDIIKEAGENIDNNFDKLKKNAKEQLVFSDGSDVLKEREHELEKNVEKTKDLMEKKLERLKIEKDLAIANKINILKEKKDKMNDYVKEAEENSDIDLDKLKKNVKQIALTDESNILKEKLHKLENNIEETKHHIDKNLEKLNYEKDLAVSYGHNSLKDKIHKLKDSVKDASYHLNNDLEKLKYESQKAAISSNDDVLNQYKHEKEDKLKETHDHSKLSKLKHDVNKLVTSNEHALKHKVNHLKNNFKNTHDDSSSDERSRDGSLHESNINEGSSDGNIINKEYSTGESANEGDVLNEEKAGDGRKKLKQYTITRRRKKNRDKKEPVISQIPSGLENVNQEENPSG